jgi:predicted AAA+ superfamily ATPase
MDYKHVTRLLPVPERSFFLFGPRGVGKSTWLRDALPTARIFDFLEYSLHLELEQNHSKLEAMAGDLPAGSWIVLDEIQKIPALLDEVHRLIEKRGWRFALCGSSARKLRRGGTNLLGGRALTREMETFSSEELGKEYDFGFSLEWGFLPSVLHDRKNAADILNSYVNTYIKEEIKEEGIVRRIPPFLRFLNIAGQLNGTVMNALNIAREASVPRSSVDVYFSILQDTLLGHFLPSYRPQSKVREQTHPKFYWFDSGVARAAAGLLFEPVERTWKGTSLETMIFHELRVYNQIKNLNRGISYYRTAAGSEIDFVIETRKRQQSSPAHIICIEVKLAEKWDKGWESAMRSLKKEKKVIVDRMIGIYTGQRPYHFEDLDVLPVGSFLNQLYSGKIF